MLAVNVCSLVLERTCSRTLGRTRAAAHMAGGWGGLSSMFKGALAIGAEYLERSARRSQLRPLEQSELELPLLAARLTDLAYYSPSPEAR